MIINEHDGLTYKYIIQTGQKKMQIIKNCNSIEYIYGTIPKNYNDLFAIISIIKVRFITVCNLHTRLSCCMADKIINFKFRCAGSKRKL